MEDPELKEAESCYDTSIDPDIALSYIGEKVQNVLGHLRKDFEGGVSAENLGAKFGGYGSFLPTYLRSPSIRSQPKTPQTVENIGTPRSPNNFPVEATTHHKVLSDVTSYETPLVSHENLSHNHKVSSADRLAKQASSFVLTKGAEKRNLKPELFSSQSVNPTDQRLLRVKIKMCSNNTAQRNVIYGDLGLISPSSMENISEESGGVPSEAQESLGDSPVSILRIMTAFPIRGEVLLSPLNDDILCIIRNDEVSRGKKYASVKSNVEDSLTLDDSGRMLGDGKAKKKKFVGKHEIREELNGSMDFEHNMISHSNRNTESQNLRSKERLSNKLKLKSLPSSISNDGDSFKASASALEASVESEKDVSVKVHVVNKDSSNNSLLSTDFGKENSIESISGKYAHKFEHQEVMNSSMEKIREDRVRNSRDHQSFDSGKSSRRKVNTVPTPSMVDPDVSKCVKRDFKEDMNHLRQNVGPNHAFNGQDEEKSSHASKRLSSEGKKKLKGSQDNSNFSEDVVEESSRPHVSNGIKKSTSVQHEDKFPEEGLRAGVSTIPKVKKTSEKGSHKVHNGYKIVPETRLECPGKKVDSLEKPSGDRRKDYNVEYVNQQHAIVDRLSSSTCERVDDQLPSKILKEAPKDGPPTDGLTSETELASVAPVVIAENWVCCDRCQKWRLLPYGITPDQLPEKWLCSMQNWLPGMNYCNISEEDSQKAFYASYQLPVPQSQSNLQGGAGAQHSIQNSQNLSYDGMPRRGKKKNKLKETPNMASNHCVLQNSKATKNLLQELVKGESLNEAHRPLQETNLMEKSNSHHLNKFLNLGSENADKQKEKHVDSGGKMPKRKETGEIVQHTRGTSKKIKIEGLSTDKFSSFKRDGDYGKLGLSSNSALPTKTAGRGMQKYSEKNQSNNLNLEWKKKSVEKLVDIKQVHALQENGSLNRKESDKIIIHVKKRKLKARHEDQDDVRTLYNNESHLLSNKESMKEVNGGREFSRKNKSRMARDNGKDSSSNKGDDGSNRRVKATQIPLSDDRENLVDSNLGNDQQPNKYRAKTAYRISLDDIESLKRDLGSEQLSMTATSSSSKVSDLHKFRSNCQEGKCSPVESVSSSPMRTSNLEKFSPGRMDGLREVEAKRGDLFVTKRTKKSLDGDGNVVSSQPGRRKGKPSNTYHPESFGFSVLDFRDSDTKNNHDVKVESVLKHPSEVGNCHLTKSTVNTLLRHSPKPIDVQALEHFYNEDKINKNLPSAFSLPKKSEQGSSLSSKDKDRSSVYNAERIVEKLSDTYSDPECQNLRKSSRDGMQLCRHSLVPCNEDSGGLTQISDGSFVKTTKDDLCSNRKGYEKQSSNNRRETRLKFEEHASSDLDLGADEGGSAQQSLIRIFEGDYKRSSSTQVELRGVKLVNPHHEGQKEKLIRTRLSVSGPLNESILDQQLDASAGGNVAKVPRQSGNAIHQSGSNQGVGNYVFDLELRAPSHVKKDVSSQSASNTLKEAEELRVYADQLKNSGFVFECNELYFQAALKFLHGAALLESSCNNGSKHSEMLQMQIYSNTARLCETCAHEYENRHEMAAASVSYKCMEMAYMRVVYCRNSSTSRDWHDLQTSLQMAPQGDSPSSSASDLDNLNNQGTVDKAALPKGMVSLSGNHNIGPRIRPNFVGLLDFVC